MKYLLFLLPLLFACKKENCITCADYKTGQNATYCGTDAELQDIRDDVDRINRASNQILIECR